MLHNKGTDLYNNNGRGYKAIPYGSLHKQSNTPPASQWANSVQNQQETFLSMNSVTFFIHQAYNNKDLSATTVMMTKTLALFFSTTLEVLFKEQTVFSSHNKSA
jgi:hypothetical protein